MTTVLADFKAGLMVADTGLSQARVAALRRDLNGGGLPAAVLAEVGATTRRRRPD